MASFTKIVASTVAAVALAGQNAEALQLKAVLTPKIAGRRLPGHVSRARATFKKGPTAKAAAPAAAASAEPAAAMAADMNVPLANSARPGTFRRSFVGDARRPTAGHGASNGSGRSNPVVAVKAKVQREDIIPQSVWEAAAGAFELGAALEILDDTNGKAAKNLDRTAMKLASALENAEKNLSKIADKAVLHKHTFGLNKKDPNTKLRTLKEKECETEENLKGEAAIAGALLGFMRCKLYDQMRSSGDQIGRYMGADDEKNGQMSRYSMGNPQHWLLKTLRAPSSDFKNNMTKIKATSEFGSAIAVNFLDKCRKPGNAQCYPEVPGLLRKANVTSIAQEKFELFTKLNIANKTFMIGRTRWERVTAVLKPFFAEAQSEAELKERFLAVYKKMPNGINWETDFDQVRAINARGGKYAGQLDDIVENIKNKQGLNRLPAPMATVRGKVERPGCMSDESYANMRNLPAFANNATLTEGNVMVAHGGVLHGTGINRWDTRVGSYGNSVATAGGINASAQSAGTAYILFGQALLGFEQKEEIESIGLYATGFMNFGGYHTALEVFPIATALATGKPFADAAGPRFEGAARDEYQRILKTAEKLSNKSSAAAIKKLLTAYDSTVVADQVDIFRGRNETRVETIKAANGADSEIDAALYRDILVNAQ